MMAKKGGMKKRRFSLETKEILLYSKLPHEKLKDTPGTGLSKTDIEKLLYKNVQLDEHLREIYSEDDEKRSIHWSTISKIIDGGIQSGRIFHRDAFRTESAKGGYYYKTDKGEEWLALQRELRGLSLPS